MRTQEILSSFSKYIESELGIIYSEHNFFQLQNRLEEISRLTGVKFEFLSDMLSRGEFDQYKQLLIDLSTNNETSFFRDPKVFIALEKIIEKFDGQRNFRVWSAACSSGQEAISIAITIKELNPSLAFTIDATDISERILLKAKEGAYSQLEVRRGLSDSHLEEYFRQVGSDRWQVNSEISRHIVFNKLNLIDEFPFKEKFDLVFCRNVLIYQKVEGKIDIINKITESLETGGYLVLGSGESLLGVSNHYEQAFYGDAVVYKKK